jgi:hypothetical protein
MSRPEIRTKIVEQLSDNKILEFCKDQTAYVTKKVSHQPKLILGMDYNDCVNNAYRYSLSYPDWQICAGWVLYENALLAHCWNRKRKKHRDVTPMRMTDGKKILLKDITYVVSEHYTNLQKKNIDNLLNGDTSLEGYIHPSFEFKNNQWVEFTINLSTGASSDNAKAFSYAEWLYHMDGGDAVYGSIQLWANLKQYRLPTEHKAESEPQSILTEKTLS